ncbi:hypothetical protein GQ44DRAFT_789181 [Phaeosphaeriaceae sp. PMI808]|nr:hypothetical protein GQ44DRAFT_789181 [Phaeosphaeriaceae sp. PMI808]
MDYFPGDIQMACEVSRRKRSFSPSQPTSSPGGKRRKMACDKPALYVDCTLSPRPLPQLMSHFSPLQFTFDPSLASSNSLQYSSGFYQHQSHLHPSTTPHCWGNQPEKFQPTWTSTNLPYGTGYNFMERCQTSVASSSYSMFSSGSNIQNPFEDPPDATVMDALPSLASKVEDARDCFIKAAISRLTRLKEILAMEHRAIEELLKVASLLDGYEYLAKTTT